MTKELAIKIVKENAVKKFPSKITADDYAEALNMLIDIAEKEEANVLDVGYYEDNCSLTIKCEDNSAIVEWGWYQGKPKFTYFEANGEVWNDEKGWKSYGAL